MHGINLTTCGPLANALRAHAQSKPFHIAINGHIRHIEVAVVAENDDAVVLYLQEATPIGRASHEDEPDPAVEVTAEEETTAALEGGEVDGDGNPVDPNEPESAPI